MKTNGFRLSMILQEPRAELGGSYVLLNIFMDSTDWSGFAGEKTLSAEDATDRYWPWLSLAVEVCCWLMAIGFFIGKEVLLSSFTYFTYLVNMWSI